MKFGLFYEHQLPRPWDEGSELRLYHESLDQAELADRLGYDCIWEVEHHFLDEYSHSSAPEVFLAACSQRTSRIRLGHGIVQHPPAYNHPARIAERIAALDLVSNGRVEWGTGESASRMELEGFGIAPGEKRGMWEESVRETAKMMAQTPYAGYEGEHFSMPARNVIPKPVQKPHPPLWVACSSRETIRRAARLGMGALAFAFVSPEDAKMWVDEYYRVFEAECNPIGRAVNPNVAMVASFSCHTDERTAFERGFEGFRFFQFALAHFYMNGSHQPGRTDIWKRFKEQDSKPGRGEVDMEMPEQVGGSVFKSGGVGIGTPEQVGERLFQMEEAGVDQIVFLQQAGKNRHEHICESLQTFAEETMPAFQERRAGIEERKRERLASAVEAAERRMPPLDPRPEPGEPIDAYPLQREKAGSG